MNFYVWYVGKLVGDLNVNMWECNCEEHHIPTFINTAGLLLMRRLTKSHADYMRDRRGHSSVSDVRSVMGADRDSDTDRW